MVSPSSPGRSSPGAEFKRIDGVVAGGAGDGEAGGVDPENADAVVVQTWCKQIGLAADHRGRKVDHPFDCHIEGIDDRGLMHERAIGRNSEYADAVIVLPAANT